MSADNSALVSEIAQVICEAVNLHHVDQSTVNSETPLMNGGLDLDSIDVLEAVLAVEHHFNVKVQDAGEGKTHFRTLGTIASFVGSSTKG